MTRIVSVHAPSRIHLGMFSFGHADRPSYGGVGFMVDSPALRLTIRAASSLMATGPMSDRTLQVARRLKESWPEMLPCEISVEEAPPNHAGLGVGTQLSLAVAAGMRRFAGLPDLDAAPLAETAGRGIRSAVGTFGFRHGGLIVDGGKLPYERLGKLAEWRSLPDDWRIVLVRRLELAGLAGDDESRAFDQLPAVPEHVTDELWRITRDAMLPALEHADCPAFGDSVYQFGRLAGECFAAVQGGPFADAATEQLVEDIRQYGVAGAGQSSWGPTVYAITASQQEAEKLVDWLRSRPDVDCYEILIAQPNNTGATIEVSL